MAEQQEGYDLGLSLGGVYNGNSAGAQRGRAVSENNEVAAAPRARAASLPTEREMELMRERLTEVQALSRVMAANLKLTVKKERTDGAPAAAARLPGLASAGGSGRLAATSSTISGELMSADGSSNRPVVTSSMMAKENVDDPQQDPARRARLYNHNVVGRPIRRYRRNTCSMPHVKTIGAEGRRVEGYLYKYLTGKVRIVCVCHGFFQSPAEFVNHAGGNKVGNPLRQITVSRWNN